MDFELKTLPLPGFSDCSGEKADAIIVPLPNGFTATGMDALSIWIAAALGAGDLEAKAASLLNGYRISGVAARRVVLVSVGDGSIKNIRSAVCAAVASLKNATVRTLVLAVGAIDRAAPESVKAAVLACAETDYAYDTTKSKPKNSPATPRRITLLAHTADGAARRAFDQAIALADGIRLARQWGNLPANYATPTALADAAKDLVKSNGKVSGIKVEILGPKDVDKLKMGAFAAVSRGSSEPLRFIVLRYSGAPKDEAPVVLVGKGITFDTGGISIKPAAEMDEMKFDMCGAASVLGTFKALAGLRPAINVVGLIPACENMPDGRAIKPGDVVTSMSGQTIEILNTDAEGRLVLCDALTYAERFNPRAVIDIATLTGACVVALGGVRSGLFSNNELLAAALIDAGEAAQDPCWRMPLDDDYAEGLKTNFADVANIAGRAAGAVTAAKFLQRFVAKFQWAHLDIAGTAWKGGSAKGATGRPVGLLVEYLLGQVHSVANKTSASPKSKAVKTITDLANSRAAVASPSKPANPRAKPRA